MLFTFRHFSYCGILSTFHVVGLCPLFILRDLILWGFVSWDFVRTDFVPWGFVACESVPDSCESTLEISARMGIAVSMSIGLFLCIRRQL